MTVMLLLFAIGLHTPGEPVHVERVEFNHYYDHTGKHVLDQLILRRWQHSTHSTSHHITDWRLIKDSSNLKITRELGRVRLTWIDDGGLRTVITGRIIETWTPYDPELLERKYLQTENRDNYFESEIIE